MTDYAQRFVGVWELADWKVTNLSNGDISAYFGGREKGYIIYTADGWVSSSIVDTGRPMNSNNRDSRLVLVSKLEAEGSGSLSAAEHAELTPYALSALGYLGYCGPYMADADHVHHQVLSAGRPSHVGLTLTRSYVFEQDTLLLSADAFGFRDALLWRRLTPAQDAGAQEL